MNRSLGDDRDLRLSLTDATARIETLMRENARLQQAIVSRDTFLAVAAHELRNPMTPILGRVTLLRRSVERGALSRDEIREGLDKIERLVEHFIGRATTLLDLSRSVMDTARVECGPVDVQQLVADVVDLYRPVAVHAGTTLQATAASSSPVVAHADRHAIEQVLENLLSNAVKYGAGAPITVATLADPGAGMVRITVSDSGPGIAQEHQARIFERYERAVHADSEVTGYGVGLWVVRNLCEAMGGTIDLQSTLGAGSTFRVSLPLERTPAA